jgi:hypothetical protein
MSVLLGSEIFPANVVLMAEIWLLTLLLPEYTTSPEDLSEVKLPVPPVRLANRRLPVNVGLANGALASRELCRLDTLAMVRALFGIDTVPMAVRLSIETVPRKAGDCMGAFKSNACWVRADIGLLTSEVSSTFPRPTSDLVTLES